MTGCVYLCHCAAQMYVLEAHTVLRQCPQHTLATWATLALRLGAVLSLRRGCIARSARCDHVHAIVAFI